MKGTTGAALTLVLACHSFAAAQQPAPQDPIPPAAAVFVTSLGEIEPFVPVFLAEIGAQALRDAGLAVVPTQLSAHALRRDGRVEDECVADDACLAEVSAELGATLVLVITASAEGERVEIRMRGRALAEELEERGEERAGGVETEVAGAIQAFVARIAEAPLPCVVELHADPDLVVHVEGEVRVPRFGRIFVSPGEHELELRLPGRDTWEGELTCTPGRTYRVTVR